MLSRATRRVVEILQLCRMSFLTIRALGGRHAGDREQRVQRSAVIHKYGQETRPRVMLSTNFDVDVWT